ncbi:MAG: GNAT family N-acetyltransferase, partial [Anaerolineales bacterium]|nr:GNAT family N-acetyltransferase [Anaerolineales bacterium]
ATPDHFFLCIIESTQDTIGYLWYMLADNGTAAFILDFVVFDQWRGLGHGTAAVRLLEQQLARSGVEQIKLRVAFHNERALGLYKKLGFTITGYNMVRNL